MCRLIEHVEVGAFNVDGSTYLGLQQPIYLMEHVD
jgi:hypothetical protein